MQSTTEYNERLYSRLSEKGIDAEKLINKMVECGGFIAGSFALQILLNEDYNESDIDIFIPVGEKSDIFKHFLSENYKKSEQVNLMRKYYAPMDAESYYYYSGSTKINFISTKKENYLSTFDLSFCRTHFDGKQIYYDELTLQKKGSINITENYFGSFNLKKIADHDLYLDFLQLRIEKYSKRGFHVVNINQINIFREKYDICFESQTLLYIIMHWAKKEYPIDIVNSFDNDNLESSIAEKISKLRDRNFYFKLVNFLKKQDKVSELCDVAFEYGYFEIIKFFGTYPGLWNEKTFDIACKNGNFKCVKYLYENGCPHTKRIETEVLARGYFKVAKYLFSVGFSLDSEGEYHAKKFGIIPFSSDNENACSEIC